MPWRPRIVRMTDQNVAEPLHTVDKNQDPSSSSRVQRVMTLLDEEQQDLPKTGLNRELGPAFLQSVNNETLQKNPGAR